MGRVTFLLILFFLTAPVWALETDQFTVPAKPLTDLGATLDAKVLSDLEKVLAEANAERAGYLANAKTAKSGKLKKGYLAKADEAISPEAVSRGLYNRLATMEVPRCKIEKWLEDKPRHELLQNTGIRDSIYGGPFERPLLLVEVSPTVNLHGQYVGVDKVGHFAQQGYEYFKSYRSSLDDGLSNEQAAHDAVAGGVRQEHGFYGEITIGVFSNADLAANYAGLLFYRNLMEQIRVGETVVEPMIAWDGDKMLLSDRAKAGPTKPFVTEHWSEAMNPNRYAGLWRKRVRAKVADRADAWLAFHHTTLDAERERLVRVQTWYGVDYGHRGSDLELVTVVNASPHPHEPITASAGD